MQADNLVCTAGPPKLLHFIYLFIFVICLNITFNDILKESFLTVSYAQKYKMANAEFVQAKLTSDCPNCPPF